MSLDDTKHTDTPMAADGKDSIAAVLSQSPAVVPVAKAPNGKAPKMPRAIKKLYKQILNHPEYKNQKESLRFAFEAGCVGGGSWCFKENNKWSRKIWRHLYLGEPMDD